MGYIKGIIPGICHLIDRKIAMGVENSDGHTTTLLFPHNGFRVQVKRDAFSWCSGHGFYLCIMDWKLRSNDEDDWICIGSLPSERDFEERIGSYRKILDAEHEKLISWGLSCHKRNLDYFLTLNDKKDYHFVKEDDSAFGNYIRFSIDNKDGHVPNKLGCNRSECSFTDRILTEMLENSSFGKKKTEEMKMLLTGEFRNDLNEFSKSYTGKRGVRP